MKSFLALLSLAACLFAADIFPPAPSGLTVHEWGTFTSIAGEDGAPVDWYALGCSSELPRFVNDFGFRGLIKARLGGTVRMETPVIYFYSTSEIDAHVKVSFPRGVITEWYPQADVQVHQQGQPLPVNLTGLDTSLRQTAGSIEWKSVKVHPDTAPNFPGDGSTNPYYAARSTDSNPLAVGREQEKFLFYRGVGRFPVPLSARVSADGRVTVETISGKIVPQVIYFENHGNGGLGYRSTGSLVQTTSIDRPQFDGRFVQLQLELAGILVSQGLYAKEAQAMVDTWRDSWFEKGSRLIYIVPAHTVDSILPLDVKPAPEHIARVFVGRVELLTPDTIQAVREAALSNDKQALQSYQRFLDPILKRITDPSLATRILELRNARLYDLYNGRCH